MTSQEIDSSDTTTLPVAVLSSDLFFGMRIRTVLKQLGRPMILTKSMEEFATALEGASLGVVDFNGQVDWEKVAVLIVNKPPVIGFGSHLDVEGFRAGKAAGLARVVSNGEFNRSFPALLEKYERP